MEETKAVDAETVVASLERARETQAQKVVIIATRTVSENGRIVTKHLIDGSRLGLGRGKTFWIP